MAGYSWYRVLTALSIRKPYEFISVYDKRIDYMNIYTYQLVLTDVKKL